MKHRRFLMLYLLLGGCLLAVPAGLLTNNPAWGEWEVAYYKKILGFIPERILHFSTWYRAPIADYEVAGHGAILGYYLSALIGVAIIFGIFCMMRRWVGKGRK